MTAQEYYEHFIGKQLIGKICTITVKAISCGVHLDGPRIDMRFDVTKPDGTLMKEFWLPTDKANHLLGLIGAQR